MVEDNLGPIRPQIVLFGIQNKALGDALLAKRTKRKLGGSTTAAQWVEAEQILEQRQG